MKDPNTELAELLEANKTLTQENRDALGRVALLESRLDRVRDFGGIVCWEWRIASDRIEFDDAGLARIGIGPSPTLAEFLDHLAPKDRADIRSAFQHADRQAEGFEIDCQIPFPRGSTLHWRLTATPSRDETGAVIGLDGTMQEITQLKLTEKALNESEANLGKVSELVKLVYWVWDEIEDRPLSVSDGFIQLLGLSSESEFLEKYGSREDIRALCHPEDRARLSQEVSRAIARKRPLDTENRIVLPDGQVRHMRSVNERVLDSEGQLIRSNCILLDITDQVELQDHLRHAQKMEAIGQLTGGIAHDFNNVLGVVLGSLEIVQDRVASDTESKSFVETAIQAVQRGAALTHRLLAFARRQPLNPETIDVNRLVHGLGDLLRRALGEAIDIEIVGDAGLWKCVVDPGQLENVLLNLAINARDAMPTGGKLTIETTNARLSDQYAAAQAEVEPGQYVLVAVTDTGSGMPPEIRTRVFEPFFTTKEVGKGSGLGLSMVFGFAKQSGGHVTIYSEEGEGTTVKLYLPRHSGPSDTVKEREPPVQPPGAHREVVLVVEDDADLRQLTVAILVSLGYRPLAAESANSALRIFESAPVVDLLVTDVVLPGGVSGRQLARQLTDRNPKMPVLYVSGYTENSIIHHGRLDPGVQLLQKPFRRVDLALAVHKALSRGE